MGSTSETYENGTNVVVYVANENAHLQSHQHQYHSHNIVSNTIQSASENETVYNVCAQYRPSSVTISGYEPIPVNKNSSLDIGDHDGRDDCVNGDYMHTNEFASYNGDESEKLAIIDNCHTNTRNIERYVEKVNETINLLNADGFVRSESVRSVDSVASSCSSLSSSSTGTTKVSVTENFANYATTGGNVECASDAINASSTVGFPSSSFRLVPFLGKESASHLYQKNPTVSVPFGWKRLLNNGSVIYISPSNTVLNSLEQVNSYLLTDGNCFCGLDCPLYSHAVFNFDPKVSTSPVPATSGGLSKLCNHKRKRCSQNTVSTVPALSGSAYVNNIPPSTSPTSRHLITNHFDPAVVKKYAFGISDRKKRRKLMPGQYISDVSSAVPSSSNVMVHNDCDISTKENNPIASSNSQENNTYQHAGMAVGMSQHVASPMTPVIRIKGSAPFNMYPNQTPYYNRMANYNYAEDCFGGTNGTQNVRTTQSQSFGPVDDYQNNTYVNQMKTPVTQQCGTGMQHHHCGVMPQQHHHRMACNSVENSNRMNSSSGHAQQAQQMQPLQQDGYQHGNHRMMTQQQNFQQMRPMANHHGVGHHGDPMNTQMMMNMVPEGNKFAKPSQTFVNQEKIDKTYRQLGDGERCNADANRCRMAKPNAGYCNCYNDGHQHHACVMDCAATNMCTPVMMANTQNAIMGNNHIITSDVNALPQMSQSVHIQNQHGQAGMPQHTYPMHHHQQQQMQQMQFQQIPQTHHQNHANQHQPMQHTHVMHSMTNQTYGQTEMKNRAADMIPDNGNRNHYTQMSHTSNANAHQRVNTWPAKSVGEAAPTAVPSQANPYERVPPLHATWSNEEPARKKFIKSSSKSPTITKKMKVPYCPNNVGQHKNMVKLEASSPVPSFMEDPSGYLAQQTALLNNTILKQTGESQERSVKHSTPNRDRTSVATITTTSGKGAFEEKSRLTQSRTPDSSVQTEHRKCFARQRHYDESPVTSSTYSERERVARSPSESRSPIQAGTVSTSNQSPIQPGMCSPNVGAPSPSKHFDERSIESPKSFNVTAVVGGHTCGSNTITSVVAGRTNTAVVSVSNTNQNTVLTNTSTGVTKTSGNEGSAVSPVESQVSKSPLEMVQNVVSSIQIPPQNVCQNEVKTSISQNSGILTSHFLVSNNGQLLVATSNNTQAVVSQQNVTKVNSPIPMISNSSVVTNVTGTMTQVIPTVGVTQQVLGQPTVLVNTLPNGQLVFQPSVMAVDSAGNAVQIPQLAVATNNVSPNDGAISVANGSFSPRAANLLSPESSKRKANKKRKLSPQQMLQITQTSQASGTSVVVQPQPSQQNFTQAPMLQTLILPNKSNQFGGTQPLIATANVLHPVNLVHNIPTIQQFIVPAGLGGMVMANGDGTATLLPETVQLNVLTPVQNPTGAMFNTGGQGILASPAAGMVIRTQSGTPQSTAQLRPQTLSTSNGTQFIATQSPNQFIVNSSSNFGGQLSPIVANVNTGQQIHAFNSSPTSRNSTASTPQEFIQCVNGGNGQTLMVPCSVSQNGNPQNTTVVQQNTTIVQQQMTMVSNNQQLPDNATATSTSQPSNINLGQHNIILNDGKQSQNFIITTDNKTHVPQSYILSPKGADKHTGAHFILNNLNTEKQSQSFIISPPDKQLCGNFILANATEKNNSRGNFIITSSQTPQSNAVERQNRFVKHSVSTQTAAAAAAAAANNQVLQISSTPTLIVATNNTFSQSSSTYSSSPPDTTTHSPLGTSSQSPDTPTSSLLIGSTDDVASPTSSTTINSDLQTRQPMVHCISSSNVVDWSEAGIEEKKVNIIVDHGSSEIIAGIDVFPSLRSIQPHFQRRSSSETKESISYIESSSNFDETSSRK